MRNIMLYTAFTKLISQIERFNIIFPIDAAWSLKLHPWFDLSDLESCELDRVVRDVTDDSYHAPLLENICHTVLFQTVHVSPFSSHWLWI